MEPGTLLLKMQEIDTGFGRYRQIVDATVEGAPVVLVSDEAFYHLPDHAIALDGDVIQLGELVLRNTHVRNPAMMATYYYVVDGGFAYALWWRLCQWLERVQVNLILTLAVWGLGCFPKEGTIPAWSDVWRRWKA